MKFIMNNITVYPKKITECNFLQYVYILCIIVTEQFVLAEIQPSNSTGNIDWIT